MVTKMLPFFIIFVYMSYQSDNLQRIKDLVIKVDKCADFRVDFNTNKLLVYTKSIDKEREILHAFRINNVVYKTDHTKDLNRFNIEL